jgi:hypothetical protein
MPRFLRRDSASGLQSGRCLVQASATNYQMMHNAATIFCAGAYEVSVDWSSVSSHQPLESTLWKRKAPIGRCTEPVVLGLPWKNQNERTLTLVFRFCASVDQVGICS